MFQIHEIVIHPTAGACKIQDIRLEKFSGKPVSKAQIDAILDHVHRLPSLWVADATQRAAAFDEILKAQDHERTLKMIGELIEHRQKALKERKKPRQSDERLLQEAEKRVQGEFSYALGLDEEATVRYIVERVG